MNRERAPQLAARAVAFRYPGAACVLSDVTLAVTAGELLVITGPNGAGKSTLLRILAGIHAPHAGQVTFGDEPLHRMKARERARVVAFLPQAPEAAEDVSAEEVVRLGRHPYLGLRVFESPQDVAIVRDAMIATGTGEFAARPLVQLSGGEAQRVHLAACLAQQPRVLLLDEPTSDLDVAQQLHIFALLRRLAHRDGLAVVVVAHDLNLAGRFADRVALLHDGRIAALGKPHDVLRADVLRPVYRVDFTRVAAGPDENAVLIPQLPRPTGAHA
jgi:iron complex transport system ATP-binding protein